MAVAISQYEGLIALVVCLSLIFPAAISLITAKKVWVKTSFYLGRICFNQYSRDPYSCALLRAFQASQNLSTTQQLEALAWLKSRYSRYKGKLFSGDMLLIVMIEAMLKRPGDINFVHQEIKLLSKVGEDSIPRGVSEFFCKLTLAPALASGQWGEVLVVANQWNTPSNNRIAKYVINYYSCHVNKMGCNCRWVDMFMASLFAPRKKKLRIALQKLTDGAGRIETQHVIPRQWIRRINYEPYEREVLTKEVQYILTNETKYIGIKGFRLLGCGSPRKRLQVLLSR